jgi:hypothetical protein
LPTRRFVNALFDDHHIIPLCRQTQIIHREPEG